MSVQQQTISLQTGDVISARYVIDRPLGAGGMGQVYLARQRPFDREVVIKVMHPRHVSEAELRQRFFNEARAASQLTHPNTITVYDFGQTDEDIHYIAMEYVDGQSLHEVLSKQGALPIDRAVPLVVQVAQSLGEAHRKHIIHRDLKPENIMLARPGGAEEFAKVLDFGIAKLVDSGQGLTQTGSVFGTPGYMPPEQARGDVELDATADLYALTCCLYEMLTGRMPYQADSALGVIMKHQTEEIPRLGSNFPAALDEFLARGMAKHPTQRPQTAEDYIAELLACFVDGPKMGRASTPRSGSPAATRPASSPVPATSTTEAAVAPRRPSRPTRKSEPAANTPQQQRTSEAPERQPSRPQPSQRSGSRPRYSPPAGALAPFGADDSQTRAASSPRTPAPSEPAPSGPAPSGPYDSQTRVAPSSMTPAQPAPRWPWALGGAALAAAAAAAIWMSTGLPGTRESAAASAQAAPATVELAVESDPPVAMVSVDGRRVGTTPTTLALPADRAVSLRVEKDGFEPQVFEGFRADEAASKKLVVPLDARTITVEVTSPVSGGELRINGTSYGSLPAGRTRQFQVRWPDDHLRVVISYDGFDDYVENLPPGVLAPNIRVAPARADLVPTVAAQPTQ